MAKKAPKPALDTKKLTPDELIALVRKKYGACSLMRASQANFIQVHRSSSGVHSLDFAMGGGYPYGRYTHIYGAEGVCKTFLCYLAAAVIHRTHPEAMVVWVDLERVFDARRAEQIGVDLSRLLLINQSSIEDSLSVAETFIQNEYVKLFIFDSVAALTTLAELEAEVCDQQMGVGARLLNKFLRRWTAKNSPKQNKVPGSFVILTNQVREKIQKGGNPNMPPKPQPTGGRGLRFFCSINLEVSKGEFLTLPGVDEDNDKTVIGHEVKALVVKNNTFPPNRVGKFCLCVRPYEIGGGGDSYVVSANHVDNARDLLRYAVFHKIIVTSGQWYSYKEKKWNGKLAAQVALHNDPKFSQVIYNEVMDAIKRCVGYGKDKAEAKPKTGVRNIKTIRRQKAAGQRKSVA